MAKFYPRKVIRGIIYKRCGRCREYLPTTEFHPFRGPSYDHLQGYCKDCNRNYKKHHKLGDREDQA